MKELAKLEPLAPAKIPKIPYAAFDEFTQSAKSAVAIYKELGKALKDIYERCPMDAIERGRRQLEGFERYGCKVVRGCKRDEKQFEPEEAYDDDGVITKRVVSRLIAALIGSFPNANPADPETYTTALIEEVLVAAPLVTALDAACRKIRRSARFLPTISEVLAAIEEEGKIWDQRWEAINFSDEIADDLRQRITEETERRSADKAKDAKAASFALGDRVAHPKFGEGSVCLVDGNRICVVFDTGDQLPRLIVGDFLVRVDS